MTDFLHRLEQVAQEATPGPWQECGHDRGGCDCCLVWSTSAQLPVVESAELEDVELPSAEQSRNNARFIATWSPSTALKVVAVLKAARTVVDNHRVSSRGDIHALDIALNELVADTGDSNG